MLRWCSSLQKTDIIKRCFTLSLCTSPLIGAYVFSHTEASSPFQCIFLATTGIPCPGCGLTRSFLAVAHNNIPEALTYHLFGPLLFISLIIASVHLILELLSRRAIKPFYGRLLRSPLVQFTFLGAILSYHFLRLSLLFLSGELATSFHNSPLGQFI